jgi:hypothetical protein
MNFEMKIFFGLMVAAAYLIAPVMLIWGWVRWFKRREAIDRPFFLALIGFILSTASALLAIASVAYAGSIHGFSYYDPRLLRIYRWGGLLSLGGMVLGFTGSSRPNSLRWQAPLAGLGMLAFWLIAAESE